MSHSLFRPGAGIYGGERECSTRLLPSLISTGCNPGFGTQFAALHSGFLRALSRERATLLPRRRRRVRRERICPPLCCCIQLVSRVSSSAEDSPDDFPDKQDPPRCAETFFMRAVCRDQEGFFCARWLDLISVEVVMK